MSKCRFRNFSCSANRKKSPPPCMCEIHRRKAQYYRLKKATNELSKIYGGSSMRRTPFRVATPEKGKQRCDVFDPRPVNIKDTKDTLTRNNPKQLLK